MSAGVGVALVWLYSNLLKLDVYAAELRLCETSLMKDVIPRFSYVST